MTMRHIVSTRLSVPGRIRALCGLRNPPRNGKGQACPACKRLDKGGKS